MAVVESRDLSMAPQLTRKPSTIWQRFRKHPTAMLGLIILLVFVAMALLTSAIVARTAASSATPALLPPSASNWMGTDNFGRDVFSRFLYGVRVSLAVGFGAATLSSLIGVLIGAIAGYFGGWVDSALMRTADVFLTIPELVLGLALAAILGGSITNIILIIGFLGWPRSARLVRAEFLSLREREFVQAAKAVGSSQLWIIGREILPNALPPVLVNASLEVGRAIILEASLSFLGLGDYDAGSWGIMLQDAQRFLRRAWWMSVFPGLGIALASVSANLIGEGLNDAMNPKVEGR